MGQFGGGDHEMGYGGASGPTQSFLVNRPDQQSNSYYNGNSTGVQGGGSASQAQSTWHRLGMGASQSNNQGF